MVSNFPVILFLQEKERYFELDLFLAQQTLKPNIFKRSLPRKRRDINMILQFIAHIVYIFSHTNRRRKPMQSRIMLRTLERIWTVFLTPSVLDFLLNFASSA